MELPREPTSIPQARRYERIFAAPRSKVFGEGETITINIPPIDRTYMTKNTKLYFDFNLIYQEASSDVLKALYADMVYSTTMQPSPNENKFVTPVPNPIDPWVVKPNGFFCRDQATLASTGNNIANAFTKPFPTFDINGPYGLINRIRVYDFLGTTLLEEVQQHDVLTAMLADFDMKDNNFTLNRPWIEDALETGGYPQTRKFPCSLINPASISNLQDPLALTTYLPTYNVGLQMTGINIVPATKTITNTFALDLYSFLGKLSEKFSPLHNGFRIEFIVNKASIPISFCTASGSLTVNYLNSANFPQTKQLDPTIISMQLSNVYLKSDLLEVSPELDKGIDKLVHFQGFKYQSDFFPYSDFTSSGINVSDENRPEFLRKIHQPLLSLNKVLIGQRYASNDLFRQKLGFRIQNYLDSCRLLFNRAEVCAVDNTVDGAQTAITAFGIPMDYYLSMLDWEVQEPDLPGTGGGQFPFYGIYQRDQLQTYLTTNALTTAQWFPTPASTYIDRNNFYQGKFFITFDTRLPGTTSDTVGGINTTKSSLEYSLIASQEVCWKSIIDVFQQHDALLKIDPGKTSTVSF